MKILSKNKKWLFDYEVVDTIDAGIVLSGHEVKSIKTSSIQLSDSHIKVNHEWKLMLYNLSIPRYKFTAPSIVPGYSSKQPRSLLVTKKQLWKLFERTKKTWLVMIPTTLRISKTGYIKITIWLAKRKKKVEKRSIIKDRDTARQMDKQIKNLS
jgi:SsrA-binding protein